MAEKDLLPEDGENQKAQEEIKSPLQAAKEGWYDKVPLTLKQLDRIITVCWILIVLVIIVIVLDAMDIFNPFGY